MVSYARISECFIGDGYVDADADAGDSDRHPPSSIVMNMGRSRIVTLQQRIKKTGMGVWEIRGLYHIIGRTGQGIPPAHTRQLGSHHLL